MRPELLKIKKADFEDKILSKLNKADKALFESNYVFNGDENVYNLKEGLNEAITDKLIFKLKSISFLPFLSIGELAQYLRELDKRYALIFAYNGTGKTRLSMDFRQAGKQVDADGNVTARDTLYFNAFTEDLFSWDNDLDGDTHYTNNPSSSSNGINNTAIGHSAINFKPIGICCFSNFIFSSEQNFYTITSFNNDVPNLFSKLTLCENKTEKLKLVEQFLMAKFNPIPNLVALLKAVKLLRDFENKISIIDIAKSVNLNQKQLNRYFNKYIGCSPAHFRRIERFRRSIYDYVNPDVKSNLTELAYKFEYTDQAHLINEFKKLTNYTPKIFFKNLSVLGNGKILWKVK